YPMVIVLVVISFCLLAYAYADDYHIKPGDTIGVTVLGEAELTKHAVVDPQGNISMPLIAELHVEGLTLSQTAQELTKQLSKYIKGPQVSVELVESAKLPITIAGEVKSPGVYSVAGGARLMDIITTAGSYTPAADLSRVQLTHSGQPSSTVDLNKFLLSGDAAVNLPLSAGDNVYVPTRESESIGTVTVLGAVNKSGQYPIVKGMTVKEAVMLAGGVADTADLKGVTIRHAGTTESIPVDYISALPTSNPQLKPGDVVYVSPKQQMGFYTIYGGVGTPGRYPISEQLSITEAIAIAGGSKQDAKLNDVRILRNANGTTQTLTTNVAQIMNGKAVNVQIQDQDSIFVAQKGTGPDFLRIISTGLSLAWLILR
ncbi:MAG TPA: polysaccharide biosynthesis/export family protein, partial [Armatimonadota bacterium]